MRPPRFLLSRLKPYRGQPSPEVVPHPRITVRPTEPNYDRDPAFDGLRHHVAESYIERGGYDVRVPREAANQIENMLIRIAERGLAEQVWWPGYDDDAGMQVAGLRQLLSDRIAAADREHR